MIANTRSATFSFLRLSYPWLIVTCGMLFYCLNYFLRVSPSMMQSELSQAFHITATQFGALASFYYFAYTAMQVPAGMLYDKFGVRFVLCLACLVTVSGLATFIAADSYFIAGLGRFMIGLGTAFAYIGTLKLAAIWLPTNRFATVAGLATAIGMTAGALSQKYLATIIGAVGYKEALHSALFTGILLSIVIAVLVRDQSKSSRNITNISGQSFRALKIILKNPQMWLIGLIGCLLYLPSSVFLDLWGIPYLKTVYNLSAEQTVAISSYAFYGWIISGPIIGVISDKIKRRRMPLIIMSFFAALSLCFVFYMPHIDLSNLYLVFFIIGACCGAHSLCFALSKESNPIQVSGTAVAVTNMLIMAGGAVFQPLVGKLLDLHTTGSIGSNGLPIYTASDYTFALSVIPLGVVLGIIFSLFVKETHGELPEEQHGKVTLKPAPLHT